MCLVHAQQRHSPRGLPPVALRLTLQALQDALGTAFGCLQDALDLPTALLCRFRSAVYAPHQLPVQVSPPEVRKDGPLQMLVTNLDYDEHKGRIAIGRVTSGKISRAETVVVGRPGVPAHRCANIER